MSTHPVPAEDSPVLDEYRTSDLALASLLSMNGIPFVLYRAKNNVERAWFVFQPVSDHERADMETLIERFRQGQARVEPLRFMKEVRIVRDRLYGFLDGDDTPID